MKGNNEFRFNEATMIEIVQSWINAAFTESLRVTEVSCTNSYASKEFTVKVTDKEEAKNET